MEWAVGIAVGRCLAVDWQQLKWTAIFTIIFSLIFPILRCELFSKKECSDQRSYLAKVDQSAQYPRIGTLSRPRWPLCGPLAAILDFAGGSGSMFLIKGVL